MSAGSHGWYYTVKDEIKGFDGTLAEAQANLDSHVWVTPDMPPGFDSWKQELREMYQAVVTKHCASCGLRNYQTAARYPCGMTDFPMVKMVYEYSGDDTKIYEYVSFNPMTPRPNDSA